MDSRDQQIGVRESGLLPADWAWRDTQKGLRVLVVDDHGLLRDLLVEVCSALGMEVLGAVGNGEEALEMMERDCPDIVLLDLELDGLNGFLVLERARKLASSPRFLVISGHTDAMTIYRLEKTILAGFVTKGCDLNELCSGITEVGEGRTYFSSEYKETRSNRARDAVSFDKLLTDREMEVLALIGMAHTDKEIGGQMGISAATVATHRKHLLAKMGFSTTAKLIGYAHKYGFTKMPISPRSKLK